MAFIPTTNNTYLDGDIDPDAEARAVEIVAAAREATGPNFEF